MSLRIRRGTDAQRTGITPLEGELLYAIDTKKLYVGDGTTAGGIAIDSTLSVLNDLGNVTVPTPSTNDVLAWSGTAWVNTAPTAATELTNLTDVDITSRADKDILRYNSASSKFENIQFSSNDLNDVVSSTKDIGDVLKWNGVAFAAAPELYQPNANLNNSIVADDSSLLVDAFNGQLRGTFLGNGFGDWQGNFKGSVFAEDSSMMIDAVNGRLVGELHANHVGDVIAGNGITRVLDNGTNGTDAIFFGKVEGVHEGDQIGSVFADDSSLMIDGTNSRIVGKIDTTQEANFGDSVNLFQGIAPQKRMTIWQDNHISYAVTALNISNTGETAIANEIGFFKTRGTSTAIAASQAGDGMGGVSWSGYDGSQVQVGSSIKSDIISISANNIATNLCFYVRNGLIATYNKKAELSETGVWKVDEIQSFTTNGDLTIIANGSGAVNITDVVVKLPNLPTSDPAVAGQLWRSGNDVKISTG